MVSTQPVFVCSIVSATDRCHRRGCAQTPRIAQDATGPRSAPPVNPGKLPKNGLWGVSPFTKVNLTTQGAEFQISLFTDAQTRCCASETDFLLTPLQSRTVRVPPPSRTSEGTRQKAGQISCSRRTHVVGQCWPTRQVLRGSAQPRSHTPFLRKGAWTKSVSSF